MPARNIKPWLWMAGFIVLFDQISKWIVLGTLRPGDSRYVAPFWNWVLAFNPGASFSFLADAGGWQRWFLILLSLAVSAWIVTLLRKHSGEFRLSLSLTLVLGGALGNLVDRVRFGVVIDFIQWHAAGYRWPAFNLADAAITLGAILLLWDQLGGRKQS
ncbi:MAG: signal peptidase II [Candidatus Accumulibacter sp.]|nr:signal peptidase II [Accumulibacter sp.]